MSLRARVAARIALGALLACGGAPRAAPPAVEPHAVEATTTQDVARRPALSEEDARTANALEAEAVQAFLAERFDDALAAAEKLQKLRAEKLGEKHWLAISSRYFTGLVQRAKTWSPETLAACKKARALAQEAWTLEARGDFAAAAPLRKAYLAQVREALGADHPEVATAAGQLGSDLHALGRYAEAEALLREALAVRRRLLGDEHPETAAACNNLAVALNTQRRFAEGEPLLREALAVRVRLFGDGPETATNYANLASCLALQGQAAAAEALHRKALALREKAFGEGAVETAADLNNVAGLLNERGRYAEAEILYRKALAAQTKAKGEKHPDVALARNNLGMNQFRQGKPDDAAALFRAALAQAEEASGADHLSTALYANNLAAVLQSQGKDAEAERLFRQALDARRRWLGPDHRDVLLTANNLADCLAQLGRGAEAETLHREILEARTRILGPDHPDLAASCNNLAAVLEAQGKVAEGEPLRRRALAVARRFYGDDHPDTSSYFVNVACALAAQGKTAEALEHCERGAAGYEAARIDAAAGGLDRAGFGRERSPYRLLATLRLRAGDPVGAWEAVELDLARGTLDEAARRRGATFSDSEVKESRALRARLDALQSDVSALALQPSRTPAQTAQLEGLGRERTALEGGLARIAAAAARREIAGLAKIQAALPSDGALVAWVDWSGGTIDAREHWGVVLRSKGDPLWVALPGAGAGGAWTDEDGGAAYRLFYLLQRSEVVPPKRIAAAAERLYLQRLAPLEQHPSGPLAGVKQLYVVAVNRMAGAPIETLSDRYVVSYIPSGTFLARLRERPRPVGPAAVLALGDPVFRKRNGMIHSSEDVYAPKNKVANQNLYVVEIESGGAAAAAGIRTGDRLLSYDGVAPAGVEELAKLVEAHGAKGPAAVRIERDSADGPAVLTLAVAAGKLGAAFARSAAAEAIGAAAARSEDDAWPELPGTAVELSRLAQLFGPERTALLQGADASFGRLEEMRVAGSLKEFRYLHFATHGQADDVRAFGSRLILAAEASAAPEDAPAAGGPPAAAPAGASKSKGASASKGEADGKERGAGRRREDEDGLRDGALTAGDVLDGWKLDAELVTLSACESGLGKEGGGEGLLGFAQAFLLAGGRSVCLSLWKVDDAATALLMDRFYQNLLGRRPELAASGPLPKAAALAEAKAWLRSLPLEEARTLTEVLARGATRGKGQAALPLLAAPKPASGSTPASGSPAAAPAAEKTPERPFAHPRYWAAFVLVGDPN